MSDSEAMSPNDMDRPNKKKRRRLSIEERIMIIDRLASGYSNTRLAQEFGVSGAAISKIGKNIENYINYNENGDSGSTRRKMTDNTAFEKAIFKWYKQKRCLCEAVPVHVLRDKAVELNEKMNDCDTFRAGNSWVQRFKERHKIRHFPNQKSDLEDEVALNYCDELIKLIEERNIDPDNIYNADETVLFWKSIPKERTLYKRKAQTTNVDCVTVMVCSNATGTHKLPLLVIGTEELSDTENDRSLAYVYKNQKDGLMNQEIFLKWYREIFLSEIRDRHANDNDRCILIIDNAPPHSSTEILNKEDDICEIRPIHFEITPFIQPLNQGIIRKTKALYKTKLINDLLDQKTVDIDAYCQSLTLEGCLDMLVEAWNKISEVDTKSAWQKVIVREPKRVSFDEDNSVADLVPLLRRLPGCSRYNVYNARDWIEEEADQPGWEILTDEEIINEVMRDHREAIKLYETQMQTNKEKKKERRKPLANNYETPLTKTEMENNAYIPSVVIKEEVDEFVLDESMIKQEEVDEEENMFVEQNAVFLDEYSGGNLQPEDTLLQDGLNNDPVPMMSSNIKINDVRTGAFAKYLHEKKSKEDDKPNKKSGTPSAFDAMTAIDVVYKWFEKRMECKQADLIRLRQMREIARIEILKTVNKP